MEANIRDVEVHELEQMSEYAYQLNSNPIHKCKAFPAEYDNILKQFKKILDHSDDELLVLSDDENIYGLLALCVEPEDMYIEAIGGVFAKNNYDVIAKEFFKYLREKYQGYRYDAAYPNENQQAINFMQSIGAKLLGYDYELRLRRDDYVGLSENDRVIRLDEAYYKRFTYLHDRLNPDVYWTGDRLLKALDKFDIFIALDKDEVIGFVVTSKFMKSMEEIYFCNVAEINRNLGYGTDLINTAVMNAFNNGINEIIVMVDKENDIASHICGKLGFNKVDTCITYSITIK